MRQTLNPKRSKQAQDKVAPATIAMMRFSGGMMLTTRDVSQFLGVHSNTVRRWSNKAILKCYRLGSRGDRRFRRDDIDAFLKETSYETKNKGF
ncbi:MAG TPA: helix-turn-helix domain-containing protein [Dehalococcoidales bacterium]|nr:helix-turn-helix domain-containing protein [Dehalococcoidales bacterium]